MNLCGALRRILSVKAQFVKQFVGRFLQRFAQLRCLFPALSCHLQVAVLIRLIHKIPVQVFYPGILRPQEYPAIPVPLGLPGHLGGKPVGADIVADLIRCRKRRQYKEIKDAKTARHKHCQLRQRAGDRLFNQEIAADRSQCQNQHAQQQIPPHLPGGTGLMDPGAHIQAVPGRSSCQAQNSGNQASASLLHIFSPQAPWPVPVP